MLNKEQTLREYLFEVAATKLESYPSLSETQTNALNDLIDTKIQEMKEKNGLCFN